MDPATVRGIERIIATIIGGFSMYLGYRLFLNLPNLKDNTGKVILPGGVSIYLSRVGPGIFFALFGAIVVVASFYFGITYTDTAAGTNFSGIGVPESGAGVIDLTAERNRIHDKFCFLNNTLPTLLRTDLSREQQIDVMLEIPGIKLALMRSVWDSTWGEYPKFEDWVLNGELDPPPSSFEKTIQYYRCSK
jgi:hypothetical protein